MKNESKANKKIRVLQISGAMNMGGQETLIMNLFRNIDRDKFEFDFAVHDEKENYYEKEIKELGGTMIRLSPMSKGPSKNFLGIKHCRDLASVLKTNHYDVVHRHGNSGVIVLDLIVCRLCGVPMRIAHSHNTFCENKYISLMVRPLFRNFATKRLACGEESGKALFGKQPFEVINNGIDLKKFHFSDSKRKSLRKKYKINDSDTVLLNVGRLEKQKNHSFLIDVFKAYHKVNPHSKLVIIGEGSLQKMLEDQISQYELTNNVLILPNQHNISDFYNIADVFIMTSLFEGMPTVSVEAQANGLQCVFSDVITKEADHSGYTKFISLDAGANAWAKLIAGLDLSRKSSDCGKIKEYDIKNVAQKISDIYLNRHKETE